MIDGLPDGDIDGDSEVVSVWVALARGLLEIVVVTDSLTEILADRDAVRLADALLEGVTVTDAH